MAIRGTQETVSGTGEAWEVADLVIDVGQQRVMRGGVEIALPKLSFDLLLALTRHAPNVVSTDQLMSLVWPGLVVGPETVVQRVKLLRQALDDRSDEPRYIGALRSRGYRLVVPARPCDPLPPPGTPAPSDAHPVVESEVVATGPATISPPAPDVPAAAATRRPGSNAARAAATGIALLAAAGAVWLASVALRDTSTQRHGSVVGATSAGVAADRTVAVLPFDNLSPEPGDAFIALGLPEMALNRLTAVNGLTVIARDSSFRARAGSEDVSRIGQRLGAAYLVGGSVQRSGDMLRVTARLVDAGNGTQLWSQDFTGRLADLFELQDEIAERVAAALEARVGGLALPHVGTPRSPVVEAYLAYLRGRTLIGRFTVAEADAAAAEFEKAIELDPAFAAAHAALYDARMQAAGLRRDDLGTARERYRPLLERALELDPQSGAAWFARAMWEDLDLRERDAAFRRAMALDPGNTRGLIAFSEFLDITDRSSDAARVVGSGFDPSSLSARAGASAGLEGDRAAEAGRVLEQALRIDPLSPRAHFRRTMREFRRDGSDVQAPILAVLELDPEYYPALQRVAKYRAIFHGHPAEAIAVIERAIRNDPQNPWGPHTAVAFYLDVGDLAAAREVAATTPVSGETAAPVLALYTGDWRRAGQAAMTRRAFEFGFNESWGTSDALRDYALRSGDFAAPMRVLRERFNLPADGPPQVTLGNYRAAVPLAHMELAQGRGERARELLHAVIRWVDGDLKSPPVYKKRARAQALMLLGETDRALADLAASFRDDRDYTQWWYTLDHDPVWDDVRDDERFQALAKEVRAYAARERAAVEELRRRGQIPARGAAGTPPTARAGLP